MAVVEMRAGGRRQVGTLCMQGGGAIAQKLWLAAGNIATDKQRHKNYW